MYESKLDRRRLLTLTGGAGLAGLLAAAPGAQAAGATSTARTVPRIVRRWARAWNTGDAELMASLFTRNGTYTDHAFQATFRGREAVGQWVDITLDSIADARVRIDDALRSGNRAAVRWTFTGTFKTVDPFPPDTDPRGKSFSVPAASYFKLSDGRIRAVEDVYNLADLMRQLGLPVPYTPPAQP